MSDNNGDIGSTSLLACLSFGMPRQSVQLKEEIKEVEEQHHAAEGVCRGSKWFFQQKQGKEIVDALSNLKAYQGAWKRQHETLARIPWLGKTRLLASAWYPQYAEMRARFEAGFQPVVEEFFEVLPDWRVTGAQRMGSLFNEDEFPSESECRERITAETVLMPLSDSQSWQRIALINPQHAAQEDERYQAGCARAREEARLDTWRGLMAHFQRMTTVLTASKIRIHETLVTGLTEILGSIDAYAPLFNDPSLTQCATEARTALAGITADDLRNDPSIRAEAVRVANDLSARFGALGMRKLA